MPQITTSRFLLIIFSTIIALTLIFKSPNVDIGHQLAINHYYLITHLIIHSKSIFRCEIFMSIKIIGLFQLLWVILCYIMRFCAVIPYPCTQFFGNGVCFDQIKCFILHNHRSLTFWYINHLTWYYWAFFIMALLVLMIFVLTVHRSGFLRLVDRKSVIKIILIMHCLVDIEATVCPCLASRIWNQVYIAHDLIIIFMLF
eukprot:380350_1